MPTTVRSRLRNACLLLAAVCLFTQTVPAQQRRPFIRAVGDGIVSVKPDQAKINFSVVTTAATAQEAAAQNATQVSTVIGQLRMQLTSDNDIKTLSYSLNPNYNFPQGGGTPTLLSYTASNTVEVIANDLSIIGKIIDIGIAAGATRVQGLRFTVKDDQPIRAQALKAATLQAKAHADAMASGLGLRAGAVVAMQEGVSVQPFDVRLAAPTVAATNTPIETGLVDVRATVTIEFEIAQ